MPSRKERQDARLLESETNTLYDEPVRVSYRSCLTPHVVAVITSTFFMTIMSETFFALYPLYAFTPLTLGGLGLSEAEIGADMAFRALLIIFIITVSSPVQRRFGALKTYQVGMTMWPASIVFLPILNYMARTKEFGSGTPLYRIVFGIFYVLWSIGALVWRKSDLGYLLFVSYFISSEFSNNYCRLRSIARGACHGVRESQKLTFIGL